MSLLTCCIVLVLASWLRGRSASPVGTFPARPLPAAEAVQHLKAKLRAQRRVEPALTEPVADRAGAIPNPIKRQSALLSAPRQGYPPAVIVYQGPLAAQPTLTLRVGTPVFVVFQLLRANRRLIIPANATLRRYTPHGMRIATSQRSSLGAGRWEVYPAIPAPEVPVLGVLVFQNVEGAARVMKSIDVRVGRLVLVQQAAYSSPDMTRAIEKLRVEEGMEFEWKRNRDNTGAAAGWNAAFANVTCDMTANSLCWKLSAADDVVFEKGVLAKMSSSVNRALLPYHGKPLPPDAVPTANPVHTQELKASSSNESVEPGLFTFNHDPERGDAYDAWACYVVTQRMLDRVGLFDENIFPAFFEDDDFSYRLKLAGFRIKAFPHPYKHIMADGGAYTHGTSAYFRAHKELAAQQKEYERIRHRAGNGFPYYSMKWGVDHWGGRPTYTHPFNDSLISSRQWRYDPALRQCILAHDDELMQHGECLYNRTLLLALHEQQVVEAVFAAS